MEYKPCGVLRCMDLGLLVELRVQSKSGEAAFSRYAADKKKRMPTEVKSSPSVNAFKSKLKTMHFGQKEL